MTYEGFDYETTDESWVTITGYTGGTTREKREKGAVVEKGEKVVIPDRINGLSVIAIGDEAFSGC